MNDMTLQTMPSRVDPGTIVTPPRSRRVRWPRLRNGVVFFVRSPALARLRQIVPFVGLVGILIHPIIAGLLGPSWSAIAGVAILALCAVSLSTLVVVPFIACLSVCALLAFLYHEPRLIALCIPTYTAFFLTTFRLKTTANVYLVFFCIAAAVAALQYVTPGDSIFNIHATAESVDFLLNQYRPTSIFTAQVYYDQFLLLFLSILIISNEGRAWVLSTFGIALAMTGATSSLVGALLSLSMKASHRGYLVFACFCAVILVDYMVYPQRVEYNYSPQDLVTSIVTSRVEQCWPGMPECADVAGAEGADTGSAPAAGPVISFTTVVMTFFAAVGVILIAQAALLASDSFFGLVRWGAATGALLLTQALHATFSSLYFTVLLGTLVAILSILLKRATESPAPWARALLVGAGQRAGPYRLLRKTIRSKAL
jgi:hypothetical protein